MASKTAKGKSRAHGAAPGQRLTVRSRRALATAVARAPSTVQGWIDDEASGFPVKRTPPWTQADVEAVKAWMVSLRPDRTGKHEPDPMLVGPESPALEKYRAARADLAVLELEERRGTHVSLAELEAELVRFAAAVRRAGEVLQRQFGNEASDILNQAIDGALAHWHGTRGNGTPKI